MFRKDSSVDFRVLLSRFSILFAGVVSTFVYYPRKKNRKSAKIIPKIDEAIFTEHSLMPDCVYLGLGSNIGDSASIIEEALHLISLIPQTHLLNVSSLYQTTPVSTIAQRYFINAACALLTTLSPEDLYEALHPIEITLGKTPKAKNAPRLLDIDILFFGMQFRQTPSGLCIPHPRWQERLFVLAPLLDLTEQITLPLDHSGRSQTIDLHEYLKIFPNPHNECVTFWKKTSIKNDKNWP